MAEAKTSSESLSAIPSDNDANMPSVSGSQESIEQPVLPLPQALTQSGRPCREYRLPRRFRDNLPVPPTPAPLNIILEPQPVRRVLLIVRDRLVTALNSFGIWRNYPN